MSCKKNVGAPQNFISLTSPPLKNPKYNTLPTHIYNNDNTYATIMDVQCTHVDYCYFTGYALG